MRPFDGNQTRTFINTAQLYDSFRDAFKSTQPFKGGMTWKRVRNTVYLFRTRDRYGNGKTMGVRSPETEEIYDTFHKNKQDTLDRFRQLRERVVEQARICKAYRINRVPRITVKILRELDQQGLLGDHVIVVGTNALFAYEAAAGAFFEDSHIATEAVDILWDARKKLTLDIGKGGSSGNFIDILRKVDKTFKIHKDDKFRVSNRDGYMVDLLKTCGNTGSGPRQMGGPGDITAVETQDLEWLLSMPKFEQIVIGDDGMSALCIVPDPRAFALHKLHISRRLDRGRMKAARDRMQAVAVARLIAGYLPQYELDDTVPGTFPQDLIKEFKKELVVPDDDEDSSDEPSLRL